MNTYKGGEVVRMEAAFATSGVLTDPSTVSFTLTDPTGADTVYAYGVDTALVRVDAGRYRVDYLLDPAANDGRWTWRMVGTGAVQAVSEGSFQVNAFGGATASLMRWIRRRARDLPTRTYVQDNPLSKTSPTMLIPAADVGFFRSGNLRLCFDDGTTETAFTTDAVDLATNLVPIRRGHDGTDGIQHSVNTPVLINPRYTNQEIVEELQDVADVELWPQLWVPGETTIQPTSTFTYFSPLVGDIEELVYAYQLISGYRFNVKATYLPEAEADDADFPYGAVTLWDLKDFSTVFIAYRARPTLENLTPALEKILRRFALANLVGDEEAALVGADRGAVDALVQEGSRLRAGIVYRQQAEEARSQHMIELLAAEAAQIRLLG